MSGTGPGGSVTGFIATDASFDPVRDGYPASDPTAGFAPKSEGFAGIITGGPSDGSPQVSLYCIDINTFTWPGIGYGLGTWDASNVPNVGFVARLLNEFFPNTNEPAGLTDPNQKAAAVQAAIWFFSDSFVLSTSDPLHDAVAAITNQVRAEGPLVQPPPPSLTLTPPERSGPAGSVLGPFTVATNAARATVTAVGATMFSDAAGTVPIHAGDAVPSGQKIWVRSTGPPGAVVQAASEATVPSGNVYLYDGNAGVSDAQRLILAQSATLTTTVRATATFQPPGSLVVTKTIDGSAAGAQGSVVIDVACDDGRVRAPFVIAAGAAAGDRSRTYSDIPAGTQCTVTETSDGSTIGTAVAVRGAQQIVTVPSGDSRPVDITDTYRFVGSLLVRKTIAGPGAGRQGQITIHTTCDGTALTPDLVIAAGTAAGDQTRQYDRIDAPATCTVTETENGATSSASVVVDGSGETVPVRPGDVAEADISDSYGLLPGQLEVTKTIAGPAAGRQATVVLHTVCNGTALTPDFVIAAGTPAGVQSQIYSGVPAPTTCVVTESADGSSPAVAATVTGSPNTATIPAAGSGSVHITDTYAPTPALAVLGTRAASDGSLLLAKTIAGPLAGRQGGVRIRVTCNGAVRSPDLVVAARSATRRVTRSYDGIPAGSVCTVTELATGATASVSAAAIGNGQRVTVAGGRVRPVNVINVYRAASGTLNVTKTVAGPATRRHGRIAILVACRAPLRVFAFLIPAHSVAGSISRRFTGLRARTRCVVAELVDGHVRGLAVVARRRRTVTIRAGGRVTAHLIDRFSVAAAPEFTG
jgi:hypothetical protein